MGTSLTSPPLVGKSASRAPVSDSASCGDWPAGWAAIEMLLNMRQRHQSPSHSSRPGQLGRSLTTSCLRSTAAHCTAKSLNIALGPRPLPSGEGRVTTPERTGAGSGPGTRMKRFPAMEPTQFGQGPAGTNPSQTERGGDEPAGRVTSSRVGDLQVQVSECGQSREPHLPGDLVDRVASRLIARTVHVFTPPFGGCSDSG